MTQLDRLEALEWTAEDRALYSFEMNDVLDALPDLIRVARAADTFCHGKFIERDKQLITLEDALAPLYREVES